MMLGLDLASQILGMGSKIIERVFPDPEQRAKAQLELLKLQQEGELKAMETSMSAIIAEAQSQDRWTSRARPAFLYVIYIMILASIPMGLLFVVDAEKAKQMIEGVRLWLEAIPDDMWTLFGLGYLGYAGARSWDKRIKAK